MEKDSKTIQVAESGNKRKEITDQDIRQAIKDICEAFDNKFKFNIKGKAPLFETKDKAIAYLSNSGH